nr:carbohydrate kinase family protein [Maliibacterium massiliense]
MRKILCVGHACADIIVHPVDALPRRGTLEAVEGITLGTGGNACNCSSAIAKLGLPVSIIAKLGVDGFGSFVAGALAARGVETKNLVRPEAEDTSATVVLLDSTRERSFLHAYATNATFALEEIDMDAVAACDILFCTGALALPALDGAPMASLLRQAKALGKFTALDTIWDASGRWMETLAPCMPYIDLFMPNIEEATELSGGLRDPAQIARKFRDMGVRQVALTLGSEGAYIQSDSFDTQVFPFPVHVVDTTGAGDSFAAGMLSGLALGLDLQKSATLACGVAAHCCMGVGTSAGLRPLADIVRFIQQYQPDFSLTPQA